MMTRETFRDGVTGRYFMGNREGLAKLMDSLVEKKATMGGVAMALSGFGGMPMPSKYTVGVANRFIAVGWEFLNAKMDDGTPYTAINLKYLPKAEMALQE